MAQACLSEFRVRIDESVVGPAVVGHDTETVLVPIVKRTASERCVRGKPIFIDNFLKFVDATAQLFRPRDRVALSLKHADKVV